MAWVINFPEGSLSLCDVKCSGKLITQWPGGGWRAGAGASNLGSVLAGAPTLIRYEPSDL